MVRSSARIYFCGLKTQFTFSRIPPDSFRFLHIPPSKPDQNSTVAKLWSWMQSCRTNATCKVGVKLHVSQPQINAGDNAASDLKKHLICCCLSHRTYDSERGRNSNKVLGTRLVANNTRSRSHVNVTKTSVLNDN